VAHFIFHAIVTFGSGSKAVFLAFLGFLEKQTPTVTELFVLKPELSKIKIFLN
jgi:hypothetical protein